MCIRDSNSGFALELRAPTPPQVAVGLLGISNTSQSTVLGLQLLLDPELSLLLVPGATMQVPLAIPYNNNLVGTEVLAQVLYLDGAFQPGSTAGVQLTVLP